MKILEKSRLRFIEGNSDKVYEVDLCELQNTQEARYVVNFRYGRYGRNLREGSKTTQPETLENAKKIFDSLVVSKINKGYQDLLQSTSNDTTDKDFSHKAASDEDNNQDSPTLSQQTLAKQTIISYLDNPPEHWSLSRIIWRAGELQLHEAADKIAELAEKINNKKQAKKNDTYLLRDDLGTVPCH